MAMEDIGSEVAQKVTSAPLSRHFGQMLYDLLGVVERLHKVSHCQFSL